MHHESGTGWSIPAAPIADQAEQFMCWRDNGRS
jgi:hypothetical protein